MSNDAIVKASGTSIEREGFAGKELERRGETSTSAMQASARAEIEARYTVALMRPRDNDTVRAKLLKECARTSFAERAFYSIPRGDKPGRLTKTQGRIEGLSIRFAEAAVRISGNIMTATRVTYDDDFKRQITIVTTDLETNAVYQQDALIEKTIERRKPKDAAVVLGKRTNSAGDTVYIVQTTDEELNQKQANLIARISRTLELKLLDAGTLDECERAIVSTVKSDVARDPDAERKKIADAFADLNVMPADLKLYLGHELGICSPAELLELRGLFGALRDGEITWSEVLAEKAPKVDADGVVQDKPKSAGGTVAAKIRARTEKLKAAKGAGKKGKEQGPEAPPPAKSEASAAPEAPKSEVHDAPAQEMSAAEKAEAFRLEAQDNKPHGKHSREPGEEG